MTFCCGASIPQPQSLNAYRNILNIRPNSCLYPKMITTINKPQLSLTCLVICFSIPESNSSTRELSSSNNYCHGARAFRTNSTLFRSALLFHFYDMVLIRYTTLSDRKDECVYTKKLRETSGISQGISLGSTEYVNIRDGIFCCDQIHKQKSQYKWVMESAISCCLLDCQMKCV